ncbi:MULTISPECIES: hypothetical protein [Cupriavidus]|jgi:hypothetical protein|uniref:hypothetical protein n=1 Tax=Cupriavidus TaxID=106589 RepID=UPI000466702F|nr:hypothetical protein [Cupriavidus metallidurans]AVA38281.1 hypothetical protein C3Z06_32265 [Cupriavidus metallidurans]KWW32285.1 hypothetical protein AU374_05885 [Cupriavidus metallidurans]
MNAVGARKSGQLVKISSADVGLAESELAAMCQVIEPDQITQRQALKRLMPSLRVLRERGCSWEQIAKLLAKCQITLKPHTVRSYYADMSKESADE